MPVPPPAAARTIRCRRSRTLGLLLLLALAVACGKGDDGGDPSAGEPDDVPPQLTIDVPADGAFLSSARVFVEGSADEILDRVFVNGVAATVSGRSFSAEIQLGNGPRLIDVVARDPAGNQSAATRAVSVDTTPPQLIISAPLDGSVTGATSASVSGIARDLLAGAGHAVEVRVNGATATVSGGTFAVDVPLVVGENVVQAEAVDPAGNTRAEQIVLTRVDLSSQPRLAIVSGDRQSAGAGAELAKPLVIEVHNADGSPAQDVPVVFRVVRDDAVLIDGATPRAQVARTGGDGRASARLQLGHRAGIASSRVEARATGFAGRAVFTADAVAGEVDRLVADAGVAQSGAVGRMLPRPLSVVAIDASSNRLVGVPVRFEVVKGGGGLAGDGSAVVDVDTDVEGRASVRFTPGPPGGVGTQAVEVTVPVSAVTPVYFRPHARTEGDDPDATVISGVVLDGGEVPIEGATIRIDDLPTPVVTDEDGRFRIESAPSGLLHLSVDGGTAMRVGESFPAIVFEIYAVAGRENSMPRPIYLPALDPTFIEVSATQGGVLAVPDIPGLEIEVEAGSARFPDGTQSGRIAASMVNEDKVPMTPSFGVQSGLFLTIQPPLVRFDPPARITIPNVDGLPPGTIVEIFSFDHTAEQFVTVGTAQVSNDGSVLESEPGSGLVTGGWHVAAPSGPTGNAVPIRITSILVDGEEMLVRDPERDAFTLKGVRIDVDEGVQVVVRAEPGRAALREGETSPSPTAILATTSDADVVDLPGFSGLDTPALFPLVEETDDTVVASGLIPLGLAPGVAYLRFAFNHASGAVAEATLPVAVGGGTAEAEVAFVPQPLPDPVAVCEDRNFGFLRVDGSPGPGTFRWETGGSLDPFDDVFDAGLVLRSIYPGTFSPPTPGLSTFGLTVTFTPDGALEGVVATADARVLERLQTEASAHDIPFPYYQRAELLLNSPLNQGGHTHIDIRFPKEVNRTLTDAELILVEEWPSLMSGILDAARIAEREMKDRFGVTDDGRIPNAFRHATWTFLSSRLSEPVIAKAFTDAHEDWVGNPCAQVVTQETCPAGTARAGQIVEVDSGQSRAMDLNNNAVGLLLALDPQVVTWPITYGQDQVGQFAKGPALDLIEEMARAGDMFTVLPGITGEGPSASLKGACQ